MSEYLIYMLVPTMFSAAVLYFLFIRRFGLERRLKRSVPFMLALPLVMYLSGEIGTYFMRPWTFDCSKTLGFCPGGLPIEDLAFCFLVVLNITLATIVSSNAEAKSKGWPGFLKSLLFKRP